MKKRRVEKLKVKIYYLLLNLTRVQKFFCVPYHMQYHIDPTLNHIVYTVSILNEYIHKRDHTHPFAKDFRLVFGRSRFPTKNQIPDNRTAAKITLNERQ